MSPSLPTPTSDQSTPSSQITEYFDAPLMHIFSKRDSRGSGFVAPPPGERDARDALTYDYTSGQPVPRDAPLMGQDATQDAQGSGSEHDGGVNPKGVDYAAQDAPAKHPQDAGTATDAAPTSDSGYSSSPHTRPHPVAQDSLALVPVVWTNADESREGTPAPAWKRTKELGAGGEDKGADVRRSQSMRSYRAGRADRYEGSPHAASLGRRTPRRRVSLSSGSFANGPGMVGPNASMEGEEADAFRTRSILADAGLSKKQKQQIAKEELKESKHIVKVIKQEAKAERKALDIAVKELAGIQRMQKNSIKEEAKTNAAYANALRTFHKQELEYLAARARYERAQADLQVYEDTRQASREHAQDATEMLQEKNREIEWLRAQKAADDREREAKIRQLTTKA